MTRKQIEQYKERYKPGTRLLPMNMNDPYAPVPSGTKGKHILTAFCFHKIWQRNFAWFTLPLKKGCLQPDNTKPYRIRQKRWSTYAYRQKAQKKDRGKETSAWIEAELNPQITLMICGLLSYAFIYFCLLLVGLSGTVIFNFPDSRSGLINFFVKFL